MNIRFRGRVLQILLWWRLGDITEHWAMKAWGWPEENHEWYAPDFGFRAITIGPLEFRYWA